MHATDESLDRLRAWVEKARSVKFARPLFAAFMLLAWLGAGAHLAMSHAGEDFGEAAHASHHHDDGDAPGDGDHHHDLGAVTAAQFAKTFGPQLLAPLWMALSDRLAAELAAVLRGMDALHEQTFVGDSPPDERTSGWLLVVQTALPVRGPSLG